MRYIDHNVWSHLSERFNDRYNNTAIRRSKPRTIDSFRDLVSHVAQLSFYNPDFTLLFRGQKQEFTNGTGAASLFPAIYRRTTTGKLRQGELTERFATLDAASKFLIAEFKERKFRGHTKLGRYSEIAWVILQHYEVCATPALDLTSSLRVAVSFALRDNERGIVYALGVPYVSGSISYHVADDLVNLRLLSICPPSALWPYYQEGSLIASFPTIRRLGSLNQMDLGRRLLAKYKVGGPSFWNSGFTPIPEDALFPSPDRMVHVAARLRERLGLPPNKPRGCVKSPGCGQRGGLPTSDRLDIVAPERSVRVGTLEDRHRCEFSHRLPMKQSEGV